MQNFTNFQRGTAVGAAVVTPDDDNDLTTFAQALYIAGAGDLKVTTVNDNTVTFTDLPAASLLPVQIKRVHDTDTTATGIIALW